MYLSLTPQAVNRGANLTQPAALSPRACEANSETGTETGQRIKASYQRGVHQSSNKKSKFDPVYIQAFRIILSFM